MVLKPMQAISALALHPGRVRYKTFFKQPVVQDDFSLETILSMSVDPTCPSDSFFYDDIFNLLPFDLYDDSTSDDWVDPSMLHLSGYSKEWAEMHTQVDPFFDVDMGDNISVTGSATLTTVEEAQPYDSQDESI